MITTTKPALESHLHNTVPLKSAWRWGVPAFALPALLLLLALGDNVPLFYFINRTTLHAGDSLWIHLSLLADGLLIIMFVLPFFGRRPDVVWQYVLATLLGGIVVQSMKELFSALRPPAVLLQDSFHLIGPALQNNSFPSGHTTAIFILAGLVCLHRVPLWIKISALLIAVLVGLSRIAMGVHWPQDVLAAATAGWLVAIAAVWLSKTWTVGMHIRAQRAFALILTPLAIWGVWKLWQGLGHVYPGTDWLKVSLLIFCLAWSVTGLKHLFSFRR